MSHPKSHESGLYAEDICRTLEQRLMFDGAAVATGGDVVIADPVDSPTPPAAESSPAPVESTGEVTEATAVPVADETSEGETDSQASEPAATTEPAAEKAADEPTQDEAEVTAVTEVEENTLLDEASEDNELVIVQSDIQDLETIINDLEANDKNYVIIDNSEDGIAQIEAAVVSQEQPITALHIISHGDEGSINLGNTVLNNNTLAAYADELTEIGAHLTDDADILIYGCNVGKDEAFIAELARLTEADIAASDDDTGAAEKGGDWVLEVNTGQIDAEIAISVEAQAQWEGVLATLINQFEYNGHTYRVYNVPFHLTFAQAEANAANTFVNGQRGYLAHITNASEQSAVTNAALFDSRIYSAYIGLTDRASEGTWRWVGGPNESFSYQNEDFPGEFTGAGNSSTEDFGIMFGKEWDNQNPGVLTFSRVGKWHSWDDVSKVISGRDLRTDTYIVEYNALPNAAPNAVNDNYLVNEDQVLSVAAGVGLLQNDSDIDGDAITVSTYDAVSANGATVAVLADGSFTFTPLQDWNGSDTFSYTITDGAMTDTATVTINVATVNDAPNTEGNNTLLDAADAAVTDEDVAINITVLANDTDVEGDTLTVVGVSVPANGSVVIEADNTVTYTPDPNYNGPDAFTYTVSDGTDSNVQNVSITVNPINDAPVANDDVAITDEDTFVDINVLANDTDIDGDTLSVSSVFNTINGTATINLDGTVRFTPDANYNGPASLEYTVSDSQGGSDTALVSITVNPVNDAPVAVDDNYLVDEDQVLSIPAGTGLLLNDSDIDGDTITVSAFDAVSANGATVTVAADGSFTFTPLQDVNGPDSFSYTITDGLLTDTATVTINVAAVNDAPNTVGDGNWVGAAADDNAITNEDTPININVLANDFDIDGDPLTVTAVTVPINGSVVIEADNTVTYTPAPDYNGPDSFQYTVLDGQGGSTTQTVSMTVLPVNDAPVANDNNYTVNEDQPLVISAPGVLLNDTDIDGDVLSIDSFDLITANGGSIAMAADGSFVYTPASNFNGADTFTYTMTDGVLTDSATVAINVTPINDAPVAVDDNYLVNEDQALSIAAVTGLLQNDSDIDGDAITVSAFDAVSANGATVTVAADGSFTFTPLQDVNGLDSFSYTITDGLLTDTATVTIDVTAVNDAPNTEGDNTLLDAADVAVTDEDVAINIDVLANDTDVEGDTLTVVGVSVPANGSVVIEADNTVTYTPNPNYNGPDNFTYMVSDGTDTNVQTVSITVNPINDAPVANDDIAITDEDSFVDIDVLVNDTDIDGDTLSVSSVFNAINGTTSINPDGTVRFTPNTDYNGPASFEYTITDGQGGSNTALVSITVNPVNDAPVANDDSYVVNEDQSLVISAPGVLANDTDIDGDPLSVDSFDLTSANGGSIAMAADGSFVYTPVTDFNGADTFSYTLTDGSLTDTAIVTINVSPVNDNPNSLLGAAADDSAITNEDVAINIDVLANDFDVEGDTLTVTGVTAPSNGSVVIEVDNTVTYTPAPDYNGPDSFQYTVEDGNGGSAIQNVVITVNPVNDAPVAIDDNYLVNEDQVLSIAAGAGLLSNDSDIDGDTITVSAFDAVSANGATVTVAADGSFTFTPLQDVNGPDTFSYTITDGLLTDTATVTIGVTAVNDAPNTVGDGNWVGAAADDNAITNEDSPVNINVLANDFDVEGDTLTVVGVTDPANSSVVIEADNTVTYTPAPDYNGSDSFQYTVIDGQGGSTTQTVSLTVLPVNDAPVANDDSYAMIEDQVLTIAAPGVLNNDSDIDGDMLTVSVFDGVTANGGIVTVNAGGGFSITPTTDYFGVDTFNYTITDGALSDTATVTLNIASVNDAPVANPETAVTEEDAAIIIDVLANDTDVERDILTVIAVSDPANGTAVINPDSTITYTPDAGFTGDDPFNYTIDDGNGGQAMTTVTVTVYPAPVIISVEPVIVATRPVPIIEVVESEPKATIIVSLNDGIKSFSLISDNTTHQQKETYDRFIQYMGAELIDPADAFIDVMNSSIIEPTVKDTIEDVDEIYYNGRPEELVRWQGTEPIQIESDERLAFVDDLNEQSNVDKASSTTVAMIDEEFQVFMIAQKAVEESNTLLAEKQAEENQKAPITVAESPVTKPIVDPDAYSMKVSLPIAPATTDTMAGLTQQLEAADDLDSDGQRLLHQAEELSRMMQAR